MTNFWETESKDTYNAKKADTWAQKARTDAFQLLQSNQFDGVSPGGVDSIFADKYLKDSDLNDIQPKPKDEKGGKNSFLDSITSPIFGGKVRQPWDVLRPIQRVLEAEQKYVARPIARTILSPLPGSYEDLPGIVRAGAEVVFDPLTYIGPGAVTKAFRVAKMAPELKLAAPTFEALFSSPGSRRAFTGILEQAGIGLGSVGGGYAAQALGLPGVVGSIGGAALTGHATNALRGKPLQFTPPEHDYPNQYQELGGLSTRYEPANVREPLDMALGRKTDARMTFQRGDSYMHVDMHSAGYMKGAYELSLGRKGANNYSGRNSAGSDVKSLMDFVPIIKDLVDNNPYAMFINNPSDARRGRIYERIGFEHEPETTEAAKNMGRGGPQVLNINKFNEFYNKTIAPNMGGMNSIIGDQQGGLDRPVRLGQSASDVNEMVADWSKRNPGETVSDYRDRVKAQEASRGGEQVTLPTNIKNYLKTTLPKTAGGAADPEGLSKLLVALAASPQSLFNAKSIQEVLDAADAKKNIATKTRNAIADGLKSRGMTNTSEWLATHGLRLKDTDITALINDHKRLSSLGPNYGAVLSDEIRAILDNGNTNNSLMTREVRDAGTVVTNPDLIQQAKMVVVDHPELHLLDNQGRLYLDDLVENYKLFNLDPTQLATIEGITTPWKLHRSFERLFEIKSKERPTPNGEYAHRQLLKVPVEGMEPNETINVSAGPVVNQGYRTRQSYRRPRSEPSHAAGVDNGNTYLPYIEAQSARVAQGYSDMADEWLSRSLTGQGKTLTELLPAPLVDGLKTVTQDRRHMAWLDREISRAKSVGLKEGWLPPKWASENPQIQSIVDNMNLATQITTKAERVARYDSLRSELTDLKKTADNQYFGLKRQKSRLSESIRLSKGNDARSRYPVEFHGQYYPQEIGVQLQELTRVHTPQGLERAVNEVNDWARPLMATLDLSFLGVQGLIAALSNPSSYFKAAKTIFTNGYGDYEQALRNSGRINQMVNDGVHWAARNDFSEFLFPRALSTIPGIGKAADLSNSYFSQFGNVLRSEMYHNALSLKTMDATARQQLARTVNLISGFSPNNPTSIERSLAFAPRFFRSQMGLISDSFTKHDLSPGGAARAMSGFLISGSLLTFAANEALGNDTEINPDSPNFMRVRFGGHDMSIFGTWDTLARIATKGFTEGPDAAAIYMARTKASPFISRIWDVIDGETLSGQEFNWGSPGDIMESGAKFASGFLPLSIQQTINEPPNLTDPQSIAAAGVQFLGTKSTPLSPSEVMAIRRERLSEEHFNKSWSELEPFQQADLRKQFNLESESKSSIARSFDYRKTLADGFQQRQQGLDATLPVGRDWIDARSDLIKEQVGAYAQWAEQNPEAAALLKHSKPKNPNEAARMAYYNIFDQADSEGWSVGETSSALDEFQAALTPAQQDYLKRNTGLADTPRVKEYKDAQQKLKPYWEIQDEVYNRLRSRLPLSEQAVDLQSYTNQQIQRMQEEGVPDQVILRTIQRNPVLQQIDRATSTLRERYRKTHPEADRELVKWYGYSGVNAPSR